MNNIVFKNHPVLTIQRLELKPLSQKNLVEIEELCSYYPPEKRISAEALLTKITQEYKAENGINWGIYFERELAGTIGFYRGFEHNEAELGYVLRKKFRKQGIGTLCAKAIIKIGFNQMELDAIQAYTGIENIPSQKLLEAAGFKGIPHPDAETAAYRVETTNKSPAS
jgi:ribosomal-protein-alanine N-acetyltransferase